MPDARAAGSGAWHGADLKQAEIAHCAAHSEGDDASRQRQDVADRLTLALVATVGWIALLGYVAIKLF